MVFTNSVSPRPSMHLTAAEAMALVMPSPRLPIADLVAAAPRGDGHAVLALPGLGRGDPFTATVRSFLADIGYNPFGWELGVNFGPTEHLIAGATERLIALSERHGPVSIVGFSMGGLFARLLAARMPDRVRRIVTVCSPIHDPGGSFWLPIEPVFNLWVGDDLARMADEIRHPMPVPCTALYSREDGLVNWSACIDHSPAAEAIEIAGPHVLIAQNAQVMTILGETLARPPVPNGD
jgi:pimeloyl-ACP methyl ester carboxylesterase